MATSPGSGLQQSWLRGRIAATMPIELSGSDRLPVLPDLALALTANELCRRIVQTNCLAG